MAWTDIGMGYWYDDETGESVYVGEDSGGGGESTPLEEDFNPDQWSAEAFGYELSDYTTPTTPLSPFTPAPTPTYNREDSGSSGDGGLGFGGGGGTSGIGNPNALTDYQAGQLELQRQLNNAQIQTQNAQTAKLNAEIAALQRKMSSGTATTQDMADLARLQGQQSALMNDTERARQFDAELAFQQQELAAQQAMEAARLGLSKEQLAYQQAAGEAAGLADFVMALIRTSGYMDEDLQRAVIQAWEAVGPSPVTAGSPGTPAPAPTSTAPAPSPMDSQAATAMGTLGAPAASMAVPPAPPPTASPQYRPPPPPPPMAPPPTPPPPPAFPGYAGSTLPASWGADPYAASKPPPPPPGGGFTRIGGGILPSAK